MVRQKRGDARGKPAVQLKEEGNETIMKNITISALLMLLLMGLTGCTLKSEYREQYRVLSEEEKEKLDLRQNEDPVTHSIDDICVHEEPLVSVEKIYDESGKMVQYFTYEYDDHNRYTRVCSYELNEQSGEMELFLKDEYTYEDCFYTQKTTYVQNNGLVTRSIYDLHNNEILSQVPDEDYKNIVTRTFKYDYPVDTRQTLESNRYMDEEMYFVDHAVYRFNEYGDEVFFMRQTCKRSCTRDTCYEYDDEGKVLYRSLTYKENTLGSIEESLSNTSFSYDEAGNLIKEVEKFTTDIYSEFVMDTTNTTEYEYDERNRLIYKSKHRISESKMYDTVESFTSTRYEYAETQDEMLSTNGGKNAADKAFANM